MKLLIVTFLFSCPSLAKAAQYYISTSGNDMSGIGSSTSPFHTSTAAFLIGNGGDTFIFMDGVYNYCNIVNPPSGNALNHTIVKSKNDGQAIIDGNMQRSGILVGSNSSTRAYITIEGFYVKRTSGNVPVEVTSPDSAAEGSMTHNITMRRIGVIGSTENATSVVVIARVRDSLFEDIWAAGYGRYTYQTYGSIRLVNRRIYVRWDGIGSLASIPTDPKFTIAVYDVQNSTYENVIAFDSSTTTLTGDKGALYLPGNNNASTSQWRDSSYNSFYGFIILNNKNGNGVVSEAGTGNGYNIHNKFVDGVVWGNNGTGISINRQSSHTIIMNLTVSSNTGNGISSNSGNNVYFSSASNILVSSNSSNGVSGNWSHSYLNVIANGTNYSGSAAHSTSISSAPALSYITRIEAGSPQEGKGSSGLNIGGDATKLYYNGIKSNENWFPIFRQDRIKNELCNGFSVGWCSTNLTLDEYINGWLGNGRFSTDREVAVPKGM